MINWIIELMLILMVSHGHKKKEKYRGFYHQAQMTLLLQSAYSVQE